VRLESNFRADQLLSDGTEAPWVSGLSERNAWSLGLSHGHHGTFMVCNLAKLTPGNLVVHFLAP
jgi:hypothetical protein